MLLNLSRLSSQLTKESDDSDSLFLVKNARHGLFHRAARAINLSREADLAALNAAKNKAIAQSEELGNLVSSSRRPSVSRSVFQGAEPLDIVHDMPGEWLPPGALISEAKTPIVPHLSIKKPTGVATVIENPALTAPTVISGAANVAETPISITPNLASLRSASQRHVLPQAIPVGRESTTVQRAIHVPPQASPTVEAATTGQRIARAPVHSPSTNQRNISTQVVDRGKKPSAKKPGLIVPVAMGGAGGSTVGYISGSGPQEKAAGVLDLPVRAIGSLTSRGLQGGISLGKFITKTPLRRRVFGTSALVGGLGLYGASKGTTAQDPYAQNPMS
jgi:hypothetical protein